MVAVTMYKVLNDLTLQKTLHETPSVFKTLCVLLFISQYNFTINEMCLRTLEVLGLTIRTEVLPLVEHDLD